MLRQRGAATTDANTHLSWITATPKNGVWPPRAPATKERIRYIAALTDATRADVVRRAVDEYAARHADTIHAGTERAQSVLAGDETAIAAHLLDVPVQDIERGAGKRRDH